MLGTEFGFRSSNGSVKSVGLEVGGVIVGWFVQISPVRISTLFLNFPLYITRKLQLGTFVF